MSTLDTGLHMRKRHTHVCAYAHIRCMWMAAHMYMLGPHIHILHGDGQVTHDC